jgi:MFS family permease
VSPALDQFRTPVAKYYAYIVTAYASFSAPIWILFVRAQGLSFGQVGVLNSIWWFGLVVSEIPTGYLGDRLGRRNAMLVGTGIITVATFAMGLSSTFPQLAVVYGLWAVGQTFRTGSDDAWLYDLLAETRETGLYSRVRGRAHGLGLAVGAVAALAGGVVADVSLRYPFFITSLFTALGIPVLLTVPVVDDDAPLFTLGAAVRVIRDRLARPPLRAFVAYFALLFGVVGMMYIFEQPVILDAATRLGVPESAGKSAVGAVYAALTLVSAVASYNVERIEGWLGIRGWFLVAPVLVAGLFVSLGLAPLAGIPSVVAAVPVFFVARAVITASMTLGNQYVNDHVESFGRATTLSAASMVYSLAVIPFEISGGVLADLLSPTDALAVFGVVFLVVGGAIWAVGDPL